MGVKVPRAPRAEDAPEALSRIREIVVKTHSDGRSSPGRGSLSLGPIACLLAGCGVLSMAAAAMLRLAPQSLFSQLIIALCATLPFGG